MSAFDDFITRGIRYGDLAEKEVVISPSALEALKAECPANVEEVAAGWADGHLLGAYGLRIPYVVSNAMAPGTAVMLDRRVAARLEP